MHSVLQMRIEDRQPRAQARPMTDSNAISEAINNTHASSVEATGFAGSQPSKNDKLSAAATEQALNPPDRRCETGSVSFGFK